MAEQREEHSFGRDQNVDVSKPRRVDMDLVQYVIEVDSLISSPSEDVDESLLLENIFDELKGKEARCVPSA
jgi:hypothetical protein